MPTITSSGASPETDLFYQDTGGSGPAVVLIHGWPLSGRMWEPQIGVLRDAGYRVVSYDRRGFGQSGFPDGGYDYDTFAADLKALLDALDLTDVTLVGFSMGGGEVARYIGTYGTDRVSKAVLVSAVTPFMLKTDDNPDGVDREVFVDMIQNIKQDRPAFLRGFGKTFVGWGLLDHPVSQEWLDYAWSIAVMAQPQATVECVTAFGMTDFRDDVRKMTVPTLVIHGSKDDIVPPAPSAEAAIELLPDGRLEIIDGAPHGLTMTHPERFNRLLLDFLGSATRPPMPPGATM